MAVLELAACALGYVFKTRVDNDLEDFLFETLEEHYRGAVPLNTEVTGLEEVGRPISQAFDFTHYFVSRRPKVQ